MHINGSDEKTISRAAVAVILRKSGDCFAVLAVKRAQDAKDPWSGHIALPGGRMEAQDSTVIDTAIREALEEIGVDLERAAKPITILPPQSPRNLPTLKVYPVVFMLTEEIEVSKGDEVEEYYWIPLASLVKVTTTVKLSSRYEKLVEAFLYERLEKTIVIWGLTMRILDSLIKYLRSGAQPSTYCT